MTQRLDHTDRPPFSTPKYEALLDELAEEFPSFAIRYKQGAKLQHAIDRALRILTLGRMSSYLTTYHTVLFGTLWVPSSWDRLDDVDRVILLRHERVHLRQRRRMGDLVMGFVYLVPFFPIGLAWGRARIEWEAYIETIVATHDHYGLGAAKALRAHIVDRFVGPDYGWMWPFRGTVERWFDDVIAELEEKNA